MHSLFVWLPRWSSQPSSARVKRTPQPGWGQTFDLSFALGQAKRMQHASLVHASSSTRVCKGMRGVIAQPPHFSSTRLKLGFTLLTSGWWRERQAWKRSTTISSSGNWVWEFVVTWFFTDKLIAARSRRPPVECPSSLLLDRWCDQLKYSRSRSSSSHRRRCPSTYLQPSTDPLIATEPPNLVFMGFKSPDPAGLNSWPSD
jgi:hypothetical protein